jgi:hypothetical protein
MSKYRVVEDQNAGFLWLIPISNRLLPQKAGATTFRNGINLREGKISRATGARCTAKDGRLKADQN